MSANGRHDTAARRRAKRSGRERGCWTYVPADDLARMGLADTWPLYFRTWAAENRGRVIVNLYPEP